MKTPVSKCDRSHNLTKEKELHLAKLCLKYKDLIECKNPAKVIANKEASGWMDEKQKPSPAKKSTDERATLEVEHHNEEDHSRKNILTKCYEQ
ncbi:hypothetical protein FQR65_LT11819 [Abscondita terminalis]|nr:hypothetical protein FQR65_LT11819 [Abscondita terminalis]